jgi:hypothetical protein
MAANNPKPKPTVDVTQVNTAELKSKIPPASKVVTIKPARLEIVEFRVRGTAPLVVHRMSAKLKAQLKAIAEGTTSKGARKVREPMDSNALYMEARYISKEGWDGFHAGGIRNALISACRLVNYKMTLAKLSLFVIPDGWDATEPQHPLIRIYGEPVKQEDLARVETGQPYVAVRPAYYDWSANIKVRYDADQFSVNDVANLLDRVGKQVGICEGRPDSKRSPGVGWGTFELVEG